MELVDVEVVSVDSILPSLLSPWGQKTVLIFAAFFTITSLGFLISWMVAGQLVAPVRHQIGEPPAGFQAQCFTIDSESGAMLRGWHSPVVHSKGVVALFHGMKESRVSMLERAKFLNAAGYSIVMIDFQAHGESPGRRITVGHLEQRDVTATIKFCKEQHPNEPIAVIGVSLGGVSVLLASPLNVDAMILESVFPTINAAIHNRVRARLGLLSKAPAEILLLQLEPRLGVAAEELSPSNNLSVVSCPIYLISGSEDQHTTVSETRKMYEVANDPKRLWLVEGAGHVDLHAFEKIEYERNVLMFLDQSLK